MQRNYDLPLYKKLILLRVIYRFYFCTDFHLRATDFVTDRSSCERKIK